MFQIKKTGNIWDCFGQLKITKGPMVGVFAYVGLSQNLKDLNRDSKGPEGRRFGPTSREGGRQCEDIVTHLRDD